MKKVFIICVLFLFILPSLTTAQYEGRRGGSYRTKINNLDDEKVDNLPVPILFGISLRMITPNFGDPRDGGSRTHEGLDIIAPNGAPIVSPTEAVVIRTGDGSGSGNYVTTANPGGETFVYMHLSEILVDAGDELDEGDLIGYVGNTGNASGGLAHLHLEIRDDGDPTDPYPRINREYTLKEKISFLEDIVDDVDDEDEFIAFVTKTYAAELRLAVLAGIPLPEDIADKLITAPVVVSSTASNGDLELGARGPAVVTLQTFLILKNTGVAAKALAEAGATGYFGPVTQKALIEYQAAHGITPAAGYYGPKTRGYMLANG